MKKNYGGFIDQYSSLGDNVKLYRAVEIMKSTLGSDSVIGDFSRVQNSFLGDFTKIDRNNLIQNTSIENMSYTGAFTVIQSSFVGKFCSISWGVTIGGGEHRTDLLTTHDFLYNERYGIEDSQKSTYDRYNRSCRIGNDVWVGANSTILRDVIIGNGAVIGANSIVTRDVPDYAVVVGNPAKIIRFRFSEEIIDKLIELQWWDFDIEKIKNNISVFYSDDIEFAIERLKSL